MRKAILAVSFGVSNRESRVKTIDICEREIRQFLPDYDFFKAYTSKRTIEKIKNREQITIDNVEQALGKIVQGNYDELIVHPFYVVHGVEFQKLVEIVSLHQHQFKKIKIGRPLLTHMEDHLNVARILKKSLPVLAHKEAIVFMGHGVSTAAQTAYPTLEYVLRDHGINAFVGTIEVYPGVGQIIKRLKEHQIERVTLMPFLLTAGHHTTYDMVGNQENSWKNQLEKAGYPVKVDLKGLAENPEIRQQFLTYLHDNFL